MNKRFAMNGLFAVLLCATSGAQAHGRVHWSVTVGSQAYAPGYSQGYYAAPQGVVVWPQSQYIYGAPPSAFAQPPAVIYVQPQPVYPPPVLYVDPYGRSAHPRHDHGHFRRHDGNRGHHGHHGRW